MAGLPLPVPPRSWGELLVATGADTLPVDVLAGALLSAAEANDTHYGVVAASARLRRMLVFSSNPTRRTREGVLAF